MRAAGMAPAWPRPRVLGRPSGVGVWSGNGRLERGPSSGTQMRLERKPHSGLVVWTRRIGDVCSGSPIQGHDCEDVWSGSPTQSQECGNFWIGSTTRGQGHGGYLEQELHSRPGVRGRLERELHSTSCFTRKHACPPSPGQEREDVYNGRPESVYTLCVRPAWPRLGPALPSWAGRPGWESGVGADVWSGDPTQG